MNGDAAIFPTDRTQRYTNCTSVLWGNADETGELLGGLPMPTQEFWNRQS